MKITDVEKKKGRVTNRPDEETLAELYSSHTATEIAKMYGVTTWAVRNWIKYYRDLSGTDKKD